MTGECFRRGFESGLWYEVKCLKADIARKEQAGRDATFEKKLLSAWRHTAPEEVARAEAETRGQTMPPGEVSQMAAFYKASGKTEHLINNDTRTNHNPSDFNVLTSFETKHPGGRPRKEGTVSRSTAWRRERERQGALCLP